MNRKSVHSIADIARLVGVSKSTVSRALNNSPLIGEDTKERIRAVAREHHYQINIPAQRLSLKSSRTIAIVMHPYHTSACFSVADLFSLEILGAVTGTLSDHHYDLLMANINPNDPDWPHLYLDTGRADGFILLTSTRKQYHIDALVQMKAPFIVWGTPRPNAHYCSVTGDNFGGGKQAGDHLLKSGRRRIAFIGGPPDELEVQKRFEGFQAALQEGGVELDPALITYGSFSSESGAERMQKLLQHHPHLDGVFANSDLMAIAAIKTLQASGRQVPQDVAVVGYDNLSVGELSSPSLTTISQNIPLVGKLLAQNLINNRESGLVTNVTVPAELLVRSSS
jgi:DNA-binding LacI/PurR family transcriptional regulator